MDIPTKDWAPSKKYSIDDIVRVWNLALPPYLDPNNISDEDYFAGKYVARLGDDGGNYVLTDAGEYISTEIERGEIFEEKTVTKNTEVAFGLKFPVDPTIGYTAKAMVRKNDEDSDTIDPFLTHIELSEGKVDMDKSIGVGVGIKFYDSNLNYIQPENQRMTVRPMASSELSHTEWYRVQLDIEPKHIPPAAEIGEVFIFLYGIQKGGFDFRKVEATNLSKFFYCTEDHLSSPLNMPGGSSFWTQDFNWRPSYGSSSSFAAINEAMALGEGSDYSNNLAINSLPMELSLSFKGRTDKEAKAIVHFLQEKHFAYESIFALDYRGSRLLSSDVQSFNFIYTHPYRKDLKFTCVDFSHSMDYRNNNTVSARFVCNTESSIRSVESHSGYNERIDAVFPAYIDKDTDFVKGKKMKLNSFSLEDGEDGGDKSAISLEGLIGITPFGNIVNGIPQAGLLSFNKDQDLEAGDCIYVNVLDPEDSVYSIGLGKIFKVIDSKKFVFGKGKGYVDGVLDSRLLSEGSVDDVSGFGEISTDEDVSIDTDTEDTLIANMDGDAPVEIKKLFFCPEDCLASQPILPDTECGKKVSHKVIDPATGEYRKRVIMLKNYRKLQLETDIDAETLSIDVVPLSSFTLTKEDDFQMLIPAVCGRSSIYIEDPDKITKYPWIKIRNFEHKPTLGFNLANKPKHHQSNFLKFYNKKYKKSINQNMSTFSLTFDKRDDEEAAEILQFLESHLGYKKFRFTMPRPYLADDSSLTTQSRSYNSVFYCPSWDHQLAYKNNHTITATFIESSTGLQEDFANPEGPCLGAKVYDPVTEHSLCTFSSVAQAKFCTGSTLPTELDGSLKVQRKAVDIVFIVDTTGSMTSSNNVVSGTGPGGAGYSYTKYKASMDLVLKMITSYDDYISPGTLGYDGSFSAPAISQTEPPWPVDSSLNSLIDPSKDDVMTDLVEKGYDIENLEKFKIKIEKNRVNIGSMLVGDPIIINDVSEVPIGFDKKVAYDTILPHRDINDNLSDSQRVYYGGPDIEYYTKCFSQALAQLYNSPRAEYVSDRIIIILSDGVTEGPDAVGPNGSFYGAGAPGRPVSGDPDLVAKWRNTWSPQGLKICEQLRRGGELAKRRPKDSVLGKNEYTHVDSRNTPSVNNNPLHWIGEYSNQNNPDGGSSNPSWYEEEIPTVVMWASMGNPAWISDNCHKYVYDYDANNPNKDLQFYFPISTPTGGVDEGEVARLISLIATVEKITSAASGMENIFCVSIKNCGPHPVKIFNSIINLKEETSELKWTTEVLGEGIPKNGDYKDPTIISPLNGRDNIKLGYGGQYYGDPNNEGYLSSSAFGDESSNMLWESFNTEREVIRNGEPFEINGGWERDKEIFKIQTDSGDVVQIDDGNLLISDPIGVGDYKTMGVFNTGVAFKGMPVRVFESESGLEIVDYNIGGVDKTKWPEDVKGNYDHLPMLGKEEVIDLFFGIRVKNLHNIGDEIQIVINTEDHTKKKMDCYANMQIPIKLSPE